MSAFDPGPPPDFEAIFDVAPDYAPFREHFWFDWGPVFYRGRLDGTARVLCVASDPGPTERIAGRTLVGDAGQRVQGFLTKLGLTRSYLCLNAFAFALFPSHGSSAPTVLKDPDQLAWRNALYDHAVHAGLQAIVAFGRNAQQAVALWPGASAAPVFEVPHPSSHDTAALVGAWQAAVPQLRALVTPDPDGVSTGPNYGTTFAESDYAPIPKADLPFGLPTWFGDDHWGRTASPRHSNCVSRPSPDDHHTLAWIAPDTGGAP
ncbi:MAG: uracil-DNA glycosylase family protein [Actinomycetota bacterium]